MRATIFGATGLLGRELMRHWTGDEVSGLGSHDCDIRNAQQVKAVVERGRPDWIVLAAAYTDVDGCERHPDLAIAVNCQGAVNVANAAQAIGSRLLLLSSDYVFDGERGIPYETGDPHGPRSVYGKSKADAEVQLAQILPACCIARTSWLFGTGGKCFPDSILKASDSRPTLEVVNDQRGSPTYSVDLARAIIQLCRQNASGIVHVTNSGDCTWFDFAGEIVRQAGKSNQVRPISSETLARPAPRPKYSVLSPDSLQRYGITMPRWQDALQRYLAERSAASAAV